MIDFSPAIMNAQTKRIDYKPKTIILNFNQYLTLRTNDTYSWDLEQEKFNLKEYL